MGPWDAEERRPKPPKVLPPASREGNDHELFNVINGEAISIHASRRGSDDYTDEELKAHKKFQSTLPAGEATSYVVGIHGDTVDISIHASRGGSDILLVACSTP